MHQKYPRVSVDDGKKQKMVGLRKRVAASTEENCEILIDADEPKKQAPTPKPDKQ